MYSTFNADVRWMYMRCLCAMWAVTRGLVACAQRKRGKNWSVQDRASLMDHARVDRSYFSTIISNLSHENVHEITRPGYVTTRTNFSDLLLGIR